MANIKELKRNSGDRDEEPILGKALTYDDVIDEDGDVDEKKYHEPGKAMRGIMRYGLPGSVRGNPLGCGCRYAVLHGVGEINQDGTIEVDYMCDSGWHNYFVYQLEMVERGRTRKRDKYGNFITNEGFQAGSLEEY